MSELQLPPDLLRGLTTPRLTRRRAMQLGGMSALGLALAGCSISGSSPSASSGGKVSLEVAREQIATFWASQKKGSQLNFANWPLYIDVGSKNSDHPTLDMFTKQTGIKVKYDEVIQQDDTYYGKIAPQLKQGDGTGYDLMVITNGIYLDDLIERDYLIPLDQSAMPNFYAYASDLVKDTSYDRGNAYTMAWASGITGIGYDPKLVGKKITSWNDLLDPALKGKVGMFGDTEDLPNAALCAIGVNPETSTEADWKKAADWLKKQRPLVRKYYQQDYVAPLSKGDLYASQAWSGDIFQANANGAHLEFVVPDEGAPIWTDNMCIPQHAAHARDAMIYMDWVYQPKIAALLADYINYITPVPATQQIFAAEAKDATSSDDRDYYTTLSTSPLVFPAQADYSKLHRYRVLSAAELTTWNNLFEPIYQS
ncbi:spermidine/putrescine ABC transporter substrate-binding protein [Jatrophihabitans sp.]|uniref:polyamine ABC transporter substrate-binding protein n=1 Tax=Jatrophihabitans sp. TaxID=1932789 RepID=UPI0030C6FD57|nr:extracellular solute-binding protein family 1 [Jatrophihabitans sp.]